ncbi:MAG: MBL fold metallo-hydrolase [Gammaproteobacteria bacterium]
MKLLTFLILFIPAFPVLASDNDCHGQGIGLQVLGSGGPEIDDGRASSGYLVWQDGHARILVDMGSGSLLNFEQSQASLNDLDVILLTHLHVDHSNDLPALVKSSFFTNRDRDLPIYGPTGNHLMPSMTTFVQTLFGEKGAFRYLSDFLDGSQPYRLLPANIDSTLEDIHVVVDNQRFRISAIPVNHGPIPAIAWRVDIGGTSVVFSGDTSNKKDVLWQLAKQADILVAHHAIAEVSNPVARNLHMPPSEIGKIAARAGVKKLVLSHRMKRTFGKEKESLSIIRHHYKGPVVFADDLQCFAANGDGNQ